MGATKENLKLRLREGARLDLTADPGVPITTFTIRTARSHFAEVALKRGKTRTVTVPATNLEVVVSLPEPVEATRIASFRVGRGEQVDVSLDRDLGWMEAANDLWVGLVLLDEAASPGVKALETALTRAFPGGKVTAPGPDERVFLVEPEEGGSIFVTHMAAKVPGEEAEQVAEGTPFWPDGREEAATHESHMTVITRAEDLDAVGAALVQTRALRAVAAAAGDHALGVQFGEHNSMRADIFDNVAEDASRENLPLPIWIRCQVFSADDDGEERGLYTLGLGAFGLMEIEVESTRREPVDLMDMALGLSSYLIAAGPVINDGDTVGGEGEKNKITFEPSMFDETRTVYRLTFAEDRD